MSKKSAAENMAAVKEGTDLRFAKLRVIVCKPGFNYRKHIDSKKVQALGDNIAAVGLKSALTVRPVTKDYFESPDANPEAEFMVTDGERRFCALHLVKSPDTEVPILVENETEEDAELSNIAGNLREEAHPADLADRFLKIQDEQGKSTQEIAKLTGYNQSHVRNMVRLARDLTPEAKEFWRSNKVPIPFLQSKVAKLKSPEKQIEALETWVKESGEKKAQKKNKKGKKPETTFSGPTREEIKDRLENLEAKESLTEEQSGRVRALKWVLGLIQRM